MQIICNKHAHKLLNDNDSCQYYSNKIETHEVIVSLDTVDPEQTETTECFCRTIKQKAHQNETNVQTKAEQG